MWRPMALACFFALVACEHLYPNRRLPNLVENETLYTYHDRVDRAASDPFVVMSFSGGGVRATALAYSVLNELGNYRYVAANGRQRSLLDDVQIASSTSGGSVAAAYFALKGDRNRQEQLRPLLTDFINQDNMGSLVWRMANPVTLAKLATPSYSRTNIFRDLLDDRLFHGATFDQLEGRGSPFVILNSTDISSGVTFAFTPQYFNDICSDLGRFPVATAVAASAAVPIFQAPTTLENLRGAACWNQAVPLGIDIPLSVPLAKYLNFEHFRQARYENALRKGPGADGVIDYVHLMDGALADKLGLRSLVDALFSVTSMIPLHRLLNDNGIGKFVAIVVNARAGGPNPLSQTGSTPGNLQVIGSVIGVSDTADTAFRQVLDELHTFADLKGSMGDEPGRTLSSYLVEVDFDLLDDQDPRERQLRSAVKAIPTSWSISHEQVAVIDEAARRLLRNAPCFKLLLEDIHATPAPVVTDEDRAACPWHSR